MAETWLISDTHFDHHNIIQYCKRPFKDVGQMNNAILYNLWQMVNPQDTLYFLGDLAFGRGSRSTFWWLSRMPGHIVFIRGSHDRGVPTYPYYLLPTEVGDILLIHNPNQSNGWTGWVIHGHTHNTTPLIQTATKRVNISVEATLYRPVRLSHILSLIKHMEDANENKLAISQPQPIG